MMHIPRPRLPRPTARLRLTILYGGVFLVCAIALLGLTYLYFAHFSTIHRAPVSGYQDTIGQHAKGPAPGTNRQSAYSVYGQDKAQKPRPTASSS
jgi:hypothetical protein